MSASDSKSVAEGFIEAFANADFEGMLSYCSPDVVVMDYSPASSGIRGEYKGSYGMGQQLERFISVLEATSFELVALFGEGGRWVARTRLGLKSKRNGEEYVGPMLLACEVADGKITQIETFPTEPETLYRER